MGKRKKKFGDVCTDSGGNNGSVNNLKECEKIDLKIIQDILDESLSASSVIPDKECKEMLVPILQKAQEAYGYIPRAVINEINQKTGISTSKIFGIVTFYDEFSTEKRGKYTIKTCGGTACQVKGGKQSMAVIKKNLGIETGETTEDYQFSLESAGCLGACAISPAMFVNKQLYGRVTHEKVEPLLNQLAKK